MGRILWLDAARGIAILLLIVMHYVGALESRSFISKDALDVLYGLLRLATPFFMFTFGMAFYITASKRIGRDGLADYYRHNVLKRIFYIFVGREVIVLLLALRYPETVDNLWEILTFQQFAKGGEILIFYFFAFFVAPLNVVFLNKCKLSVYILFWVVVYTASYYIGSHYVDRDSSNVLRFLFYDIYAFFPFMIVVALAMLIAKVYRDSANRNAMLKQGFYLSIVLIILGFSLLSYLTPTPWADLASAKYKTPPHLVYMLFYLGEVLCVVSLVALFFDYIPRFINSIISTIGRNTLVSYVLHYTFFFSVPIAAYLGGGAFKEVLFFVLICLLSFLGITGWDKFKQAKKEKPS